MFDLTGSIWAVVIIVSCMVALVDWRKAVYLGILIDFLRDPVRKLASGKPIHVTLSGAVLWLLIVIIATIASRRALKRMLELYPQLRKAIRFLLIAMIPAAAISVVTQPMGAVLALIGAATYLIPPFGVGAGFALARNRAAVRKFMQFYIVVNSIALVGVILQYSGVDFPALGGIDFHWIRYRTGYTVDLMCGWYRSPDIMGLHAAHVIMFCLLLVADRRNNSSAWIGLALWAAFCVIVSGRRKMIGIPLVFISCFMTLGWIYGVNRIGRFASTVIITATVGGGLSVFLLAGDQADDYTEYASTLFTEGAGRSSEIVVGSTMSTLQSVGVFGGGLGSATQGRYYMSEGSGATRGWQEDGVSRLFMEFGVFGVLFIVAAIVVVLRSVAKSLRSLPATSQAKVLQVGLFSIVAGNIASFCISHQQYSGDPVNALLVTLILGMAFAMPTLQQIHPQIALAEQTELIPAQNEVVPVRVH